MSEHKSTPGPWRVRDDGLVLKDSYVESIGDTSESICILKPQIYTNGTLLGNANLIATSPDFRDETETNIDLLERLIPFFDAYFEESNEYKDIKEAIERQEQLISNSKGEG